MATAVPERIVEIVRSRLEAIDASAGYETTASGGVVRPTRQGGFQPKDYQIVVKQGDETYNESMSCPGNPPAAAWDLDIVIAGVLRPSELNRTAIDTIKNQFSADVRKALAANDAGGNWSGLVLYDSIGMVEEYESDDGSEAGFKATLTVTYRVNENDPYEVMT